MSFGTRGVIGETRKEGSDFSGNLKQGDLEFFVGFAGEQDFRDGTRPIGEVARRQDLVPTRVDNGHEPVHLDLGPLAGIPGRKTFLAERHDMRFEVGRI